jgi:hypothetical protein
MLRGNGIRRPLYDWCDAVTRSEPRYYRLVACLVQHMRTPKGYCWASNQRLAVESGLPLWTIERYLNRLEAMGAIERKQVGYRRGPDGRPLPVRHIRPCLDYRGCHGHHAIHLVEAPKVD